MKKILIANRGEIALRVIRSVRECGLSPVAVYSDIDQSAMHVRFADEAYLLGSAAPAESYLAIDKIVEVALRAKVFGIHPGYGFLSENPKFATACEKAGMVFLGPTAQVIAAMGDKLEARAWAEKSGIRMVPASPLLSDAKSAKKEATKIGYPVLLKASAGGGGKGMRRVRAESEMDEAFRLAQGEAQKSFANDALYLERFLVKPRHIEVQIFADRQGHVIALGDRECSIQRRHQKIIEEAPAPNLSDDTRMMMASAARDLARSVQYRGAGTVEFLVDKRERFYFLEMNTRLQVEHPVTEWTTGLDLVAWQIHTALDRPLPLMQKDIALVGHSMEVRLYAEDPANYFFPCPGKLSAVQWPSGPGVRIDSGIETGSEISLFYDPLLAKISVWGETRDQALSRMKRALLETRISGVKTNLSFLQAILDHPRFKAGELSTTFVQDEGPFPLPEHDSPSFHAALATAALTLVKRPGRDFQPAPTSPWWKSGLPKPRKVREALQ